MASKKKQKEVNIWDLQRGANMHTPTRNKMGKPSIIKPQCEQQWYTWIHQIAI